MGVGLGVITGSALKLAGTGAQRGDWPIPSWLVSTEIAPQDEAALTATGSNGLLSNRNDNLGRFETRNELTALSQRWKELAATQADLKVSAFMLVLDDGRYAQHRTGHRATGGKLNQDTDPSGDPGGTGCRTLALE